MSQLNAKHVVETDRLWVAMGDAPQAIEVGSAAWFEWLDNHDRFVFQHASVHFTARRETRRGNYYWYGYRRLGDKLHKVYLGRATDLTVPTLVAAGERMGPEGRGEPRDDAPPVGRAPGRRAADVAGSSRPLKLHADPPRGMMNWLIPPALPEHAVDRPRLTRQLARPIVLISAPSGYGKTTLLNQWQHSLGSPVVWVSLDTEANTVHTFWAAVLLAWQRLESGYEVPLTLLQSPAATPIEPLLTLFIDALHRAQADRAGRKVTLIIDNYHRAQADALDASLRLFLDHLPPGVQVVLASQRQFPFDLQRWRGKGLLAELTQDDLRLTPEEGLAYLEHLSPLTLTEREKVSLVMRADGWPAGLNLLLLALRQQGNVHAYVATFSGHDRYLQAYVAGEILAKHATDRRQFLLKTSVLKALSGPLCDALTGGDDSRAMLEELCRSNQFVSLVDEAGGWYQYHDLFAKALQDQLRAEHPAWLADLHHRAAVWLLENGHFPDAMRHLLLAGEWPEVARLIDQAILSELRRGSDHRILRWMQQTPDEVFLNHSSLLVTFARLALHSLPHEQVIGRLTRVAGQIEGRPAAERTPAQRTTLRLVRHWQATGEWPEGDDAGPLPEGIAGLWRVFTLRERALRLMHARDDAGGARLMEEAVQLATAEGLTFLAIMGTVSLIGVVMRQGRLGQAETLAQEMLRWLRSRSPMLPESASVLEYSLARVYLARNQVAAARAALDRVAAVDPYPTSLNMAILSHGMQAHILNALGDHLGARMAVEAAQELQSYGVPVLSARDVALHQALILLRQDDPAAAEQLLRYELPPPAKANAPENALHAIVWADLHLRRGEYEAAESVLRSMDETRTDGLFVAALLPQLLLALAWWGQNKTHQALDELQAAVRAAEPERIIRPFLNCGPRLIPLLLLAAQSDSYSPAQRRFVTNVLAELRAAHPDFPVPSAADVERRALAAAISQREQELLVVLAEGLTNREIAARLVLEESTIRTHLRNIYRKLGVNSRVAAVRLARELDLLS